MSFQRANNEFGKQNYMNKYYVFEEGIWKHNTPLKLLLNPILRKIQFWTKEPYVISSWTDWEEAVGEVHEWKPLFVRYEFIPVRYFKNAEERKEYIKESKRNDI
jgi:hypothetical protein